MTEVNPSVVHESRPRIHFQRVLAGRGERDAVAGGRVDVPDGDMDLILFYVVVVFVVGSDGPAAAPVGDDGGCEETGGGNDGPRDNESPRSPCIRT